MVPEGSTIVIGGLIEDHCEVQQSGVPGLMKLPYVGALFRIKTEIRSKKELIVLLTPRTCRTGGPPLTPIPPIEMLQQAGLPPTSLPPQYGPKQPFWR